ncbi:hypothetical protein DSM112329_04806 [Paraconexibacter sp. AEG42_29]|uniref:HTH tetR-type domain-containing protein n=1 Tax=Paraconexibacter sp. AEG42_29 TaxID=2997339 RepID=A0AAU7B2S8_9ACTN
MSSSPDLSPRERLLGDLVEHLAAHGLADTSLRGLAAAVGSSHRMLSYHFGSRDGVLVAISRHVEQQQRDALAALQAEPNADPVKTMWEFWRRLADPALWPHERLFYELYARALRGDPGAEPFLDGVVTAWIEPAAKQLMQLGLTRAQARAEARLGLAVTRGLLLDLLATGDRRGVDAAMKRFIARYSGESRLA